MVEAVIVATINNLAMQIIHNYKINYFEKSR